MTHTHVQLAQGKFPDEVGFNDIDHVWSLEKFRGAEPRMERVRTHLVDYHPSNSRSCSRTEDESVIDAFNRETER
jgi:hypothetical protein